MSDLPCMLAQRIVPDLFWSALVLAAALALTHRLWTPRQAWDGQRRIGRFLLGLTGRHQRPTWRGHR